ISIFPQFGDNSGSPPDIGPVCRLYLPSAAANFHFFSASSEACSDLVSMQPEFVLETPAAFYASLPDPQTGACGYGQVPVYCLSNPRTVGYRYTTSQAVHDLMLRQGWGAQGSGPGAVAMCVGGAV